MEIWKEIPNTNGQYSISNLGRVRRNWVMVRTQGKLVKSENQRICAQNKTGYNSCPGGYTHRIVAQVFIPNPNNYDQVHHKDGNIHNNCVDNLEWVDGSNHTHNHKYGISFTEEHKRHLSGPNPGKSNPNELNGMAKKVRCVETGEVFGCIKLAAESVGLKPGTVAKCCKGIYKKSGGYTWEFV